MTLGDAVWVKGKPPNDVPGWYWVGTSYGVSIIYLEDGYFIGVGSDQFTLLEDNQGITWHKKVDPDDEPKKNNGGEFRSGFTLKQLGYQIACRN